MLHSVPGYSGSKPTNVGASDQKAHKDHSHQWNRTTNAVSGPAFLQTQASDHDSPFIQYHESPNRNRDTRLVFPVHDDNPSWSSNRKSLQRVKELSGNSFGNTSREDVPTIPRISDPEWNLALEMRGATIHSNTSNSRRGVEFLGTRPTGLDLSDYSAELAQLGHSGAKSEPSDKFGDSGALKTPADYTSPSVAMQLLTEKPSDFVLLVDILLSDPKLFYLFSKGES